MFQGTRRRGRPGRYRNDDCSPHKYWHIRAVYTGIPVYTAVHAAVYTSRRGSIYQSIYHCHRSMYHSKYSGMITARVNTGIYERYIPIYQYIPQYIPRYIPATTAAYTIVNTVSVCLTNSNFEFDFFLSLPNGLSSILLSCAIVATTCMQDVIASNEYSPTCVCLMFRYTLQSQTLHRSEMFRGCP